MLSFWTCDFEAPTRECCPFRPRSCQRGPRRKKLPKFCEKPKHSSSQKSSMLMLHVTLSLSRFSSAPSPCFSLWLKLFDVWDQILIYKMLCSTTIPTAKITPRKTEKNNNKQREKQHFSLIQAAGTISIQPFKSLQSTHQPSTRCTFSTNTTLVTESSQIFN